MAIRASRSFFTSSVFLLWLSGCTASGEPVSQTPTLWTNQDADATMQCSHTKGSTYRLMYWYQQLPGQNMKLIVFTTAYSAAEYDPGFTEEKFPAQKKNAETGSLTVKKVKPEDSGVYFCSVIETQ